MLKLEPLREERLRPSFTSLKQKSTLSHSTGRKFRVFVMQITSV